MDDVVPTPVGDPIRAHSMKMPAGRAYATGRPQNSITYRLLVDYRPGDPLFPVSEYSGFIWHPEGSEVNEDGTPNYHTALTIQSIVPHKRERYATIECSRTK
jgi:hypothetical protein